jgi:hypothetical protein
MHLCNMGTTTLTEAPVLTEAQRATIRVLLYFDIFSHPLREEEIARFLGVRSPRTDRFRDALEALSMDGTIGEQQGYYGFGDLVAAIAKRHEENRRARQRMAKARRMSRFIGRFPFVRAVMLSGSISKGCMPEDGDIDYFVIAEPGRLWIARTLLIGFKKLFLFNSRRDFCVNYFVDLDHLTIEDRNLFTATEVMTLIPTFDGGTCEAFFQANTWAGEILPNKERPRVAGLPEGDGLGKRLLERLFRNGMGDEFDEWCMLRTLRHWRSKFAEFDREQFDLALRTRKYVSKHHPRNFQQHVLREYKDRIQRFEEEKGLRLT